MNARRTTRRLQTMLLLYGTCFSRLQTCYTVQRLYSSTQAEEQGKEPCQNKNILMYARARAHTPTHRHAHTQRHARTSTHKRMNAHAQTHRHRHTQTHTDTHRHTHTHTHTHTQAITHTSTTTPRSEELPQKNSSTQHTDKTDNYCRAKMEINQTLPKNKNNSNKS